MRTPSTVVGALVVGAPSALALVLVLAACSETPPDCLAMDPSGPFHFEKKGQTEKVNIAAFVGKQPYVKKVPAVWASSDTSVATVDDKGTITATGSGKAAITASAWGIDAKADVSVRIVGSVAVKNDVPKPMKLNSKGWQLAVTVKDDKGVVIEKPERVMYRATDYCVEVSDDGFMKPLTEGDCDVVISAANQTTKISISVKE